jgi:iron complex outermembrane receptor protein
MIGTKGEGMSTDCKQLLSAPVCAAVVAAVAVVLGAHTSAAAQPAASATLTEIVITAQRTETSLQETPVSITAFSSEALNERGITSMLDMSAFVPNLQVGSRMGSAGTQGGYAIRGVGINATGSSPSVGIYVDDVYFPSISGNLLGLFDVQRVEVLRGPQGTLFGRNTIAGAVQYLTVKPSTEGFSGFAEATGGDFSRADFSAALNIPLGDTVAARLSVATRKRDGYVHDDLNNIDRGSDDTKDGRLQLRWTPTDKLTVDFKTEVLEQKSNGRAVTVLLIQPTAFLVGRATRGGPPAERETRPYTSSLASTGNYQFPGFNGPEYFKFNHRVVQGAIDYQISDNLTLTAISAFSHSKRDSASDPDNTPLSIIHVTNLDEGDLFTQEVRLAGKSDRFNWTTGVYYYDETRDSSGTANIGLSPTGPFGVANEIKSKAYALYAQGTYDFTERWSGTLGARYSSEKVDARAVVPYVVNPPIAGFNTQPSGSDTYEDTSPYVGLNFQVNPDVMTYAKATKGFRAGGFNFANPPTGMARFNQESAWTYELGARMEFMDKRLRVNPTVFQNTWKDIQFNALLPPANIFTKNAGDAKIKGAELEMQFAASDRWLLDGSISLLSGHYTRIDPQVTLAFLYPNGSFAGPAPGPGTPVPVTDLTLDDDLQQAPERKYTAGARYTLPLGSGGRVVANGNYAWVDTIRSAITRTNFVQLPSYGLFNAQVQYIAADDRWSLGLSGTNLADEYFRIGGVNFINGPGPLTADPGRPREVAVTFRYNF